MKFLICLVALATAVAILFGHEAPPYEPKDRREYCYKINKASDKKEASYVRYACGLK